MDSLEGHLELKLKDIFSDYGFIPGLRPRNHRAVLSGAVTTSHTEETALAVTGTDSHHEHHVEQLLGDLMLQQETSESPAPDDEEPRAKPEPPTLTPEVRRNLRRLEQAHHDVEVFETHNIYQAELRTLLIVMMDHMRGEFCQPGKASEFDRWWVVVEIYRRFLGEPEMATPRARFLLPKLLDLERDKLTERRLEHALGRRKTPKKRKRKKWRRRPRRRQPV